MVIDLITRFGSWVERKVAVITATRELKQGKTDVLFEMVKRGYEVTCELENGCIGVIDAVSQDGKVFVGGFKAPLHLLPGMWNRSGEYIGKQGIRRNMQYDRKLPRLRLKSVKCYRIKRFV